MAQSTILRAKNLTGSTLVAGTVVYISGFDTEDHYPTVAPASNNDSTKMPAVGIVREDLLHGDVDVIKVSGPVAGFDTTGSSSNDNVYVGQNGGIVFSIEPASTNQNLLTQQLGTVSRVADAPNGQIHLYPLEIKRRTRHDEIIDVTNNQHHNKLHANQHEVNGLDIINHSKLQDLFNDDHVQYTLSDGSRAFTGTVDGISPTTDANLATKAYVDLQSGGGSGGDVFKVGIPVNNQIGVWTGDGTIEGDTDLIWDGSNLGIGMIPIIKLDITGGNFRSRYDVAGWSAHTVENQSLADGALSAYVATARTAADAITQYNMYMFGGGNTTSVGGHSLADAAMFLNGGTPISKVLFGTNVSAPIHFITNGVSAMTIDASQRVGIGTTSPGAALDVQKDGGGFSLVARVKNLGTTVNDFAMLQLETTASGGDPMVRFLVGSQFWSAGPDNNDADKFKIVPASSGGGTNLGIHIKTTGQVGIGDSDPTESLEVNGGIKIGTTATSTDGSMRWNGTNFQGYKSGWVNLDTQGTTTPPAGADTQLQFNDGGVFAGDAGLTWDKTSKLLLVTGSSGVSIQTTIAHVISARTGTNYDIGAGISSFYVRNIGTNIYSHALAYIGTSPVAGDAYLDLGLGGAIIWQLAAVRSGNKFQIGRGGSLTGFNNGVDFTIDINGRTGVGIGTATANESLHIGGAIQVGGAAISSAGGTIQWTGSDLQGRVGGAWRSLTTQSTAPAGADTQLQFNNSGSFGGTANLTWDDNSLLVIGTGASTGTIVGRSTTAFFEGVRAEKTAGNGAQTVMALVLDPAAPANGDEAVITWRGADSLGAVAATGQLGVALTDVTSGSEDADFVFRLSASGSAPTEKMRLTSGGNLVIATDKAGETISQVQNLSTATAAYASSRVVTDAGTFYMLSTSNAFATSLDGITQAGSADIAAAGHNKLFIRTTKVGAPIHFLTETTHAMTIDGTNQNVGIGVQDPDEVLEVNGGIHIGTTAETNNGTIRWDGSNFQGYKSGWVNLDNTGDVTKVGAPVDNQIAVWTGDGTIEGSADYTQRSYGAGGSAGGYIISRRETDTAIDPSTFFVYKRRTTAPYDLDSGDWYGRIGFAGMRGGSIFAEGTTINSIANGSWTTNNYANLLFRTAGASIYGESSNTPQPRFQITSAGTVGLGNFDGTISDAPTAHFHVRTSANTGSVIKSENTSTGTAAFAAIGVFANTAFTLLDVFGSNYSGALTWGGESATNAVVLQAASASKFIISANGATPLYFITNDTKALSIDTSQNLTATKGITLGTSALTTDGTIRWDGSNFQGYKSGWIDLDNGPEAFVLDGYVTIIDFATGRNHTLDIGSAATDITLTLSNPIEGEGYSLKIIQGPTPRDIIWPDTVMWPGGTAPIISIADDALDLIQLMYDGTNYLGMFAQDIK